MVSSRRELLDDVLDYVGHANDAGARATMTRILDRVLERIWMFRPWTCLVAPSPYQLTTDASTVLYPLPGNFGRISGVDGQIRNLTTHRWLTPTTRAALEQADPSLDTTCEPAGCPQRYEIAGTMPVTRQPSSTGDALEVLSDSVTDTAVVVEIEGLQIVNGEAVWTQTQVTLTGTAPVAVGTWSSIETCGKSYPAGTTPTTDLTSSAGVVTLRIAADATVLMRLQPQESARDVQVIRFYPKPDGPYTIAVPFIRGLQRIVRDAAPLPDHWEIAAFEGCVLGWRAGSGETPSVPEVWPALVELSVYENSRLAQQRRQRVPYR